MSLSGRLCLLTIVGLILPTRGQTLANTPASLEDATTVNTHAVTPTPAAALPELQFTPPASTLQTGEEATRKHIEILTPQPKGEDMLLTPEPRMDGRSTEADPTDGATLSKQPPDKDLVTDLDLRLTGSSEDNPFSYDVYTLRKRGLLIAAVLFITGIVILTSGKCRQLPRLCRNSNRTYRIVTKAQPEREDVDGAGARADGVSTPPAQPCLP